jgi:hypothetical protein
LSRRDRVCRTIDEASDRHHAGDFPRRIGPWDKISRSGFAWPWTVTAHGRGQFYPSKQAAIAAVRKLKAKGVKNIDGGCMQVNLM